MLSRGYLQETNRLTNTNKEWWNKPVDKASEMNRESLMVFEILLDYEKQKEENPAITAGADYSF